MDIDFGLVDRFVADRGFGFVGRVFGGDITPPSRASSFGRGRVPQRSNDTFFHISVIRSSLPDIANGLQESGNPGGRSFWYVSEATAKGRQVVEAVPPEAVHARISDDDFDRYRDRLMALWCNADERGIAPWLRSLTEQVLVTPQRFSEWEREVSERVLRSKHDQDFENPAELEEFVALVREMRSKDFYESAQVSNYIVENRLGEKYQTISGWLEMENGVRNWTFKGGFPPRIYAMLCEALDLKNRGTTARAVDFIPFKDLPP